MAWRRLLTLCACTALFGAGLLTTPAAAATITVNSTADATGNDSACTLREAITAANSNTASTDAVNGCPAGSAATADLIVFDITGPGPHTIQLATTALPAVNSPMTIDGYCQTCDGAAPATATVPATIRIAIDGNDVSGFILILTTTSGGATVRGLSLFNVDGNPLLIDDSGGNTVTGNHIALGIDGATGATCHDALRLTAGSAFNVIGGTTPAERNVIGGCSGSSILMGGAGTNGVGINQNSVMGNYIGVRADGITAATNAADTVVIAGGADQNTIGGPTPGHRNVIGGGSSGVLVSVTGTDGNAVIGNYIGTTAAGTDGGSVDNGIGVALTDGATATQVSDNLIAFNNIGVFVSGASTAENPITRNSIHSNTNLGIDLGAAPGITENDVDDLDIGPNALQNFPVLQQVLAASTLTTVTGTLHSEPNTSYLVHLYGNQVCDPSGNGEGQRFLGTIQATTDGGGDASFSTSISATVAPGEGVTATATELTGGSAVLHTSEFSDCLAASAAPTREAKVKAKPKKVEHGDRTRLTGTLDQCTSSAVIEFQRKKGGSFQTFRTESAADCDARIRVKVKKKRTFRIFSPPDGQYDAAASKPVTVKLKPE